MNVRPKKEIQFSMRMTDELFRELERSADDRCRTVSDMVHLALEEKFIKRRALREKFIKKKEEN